MSTIRRSVAAIAATALLALTSIMLATPAQAQGHSGPSVKVSAKAAGKGGLLGGKVVPGLL